MEDSKPTGGSSLVVELDRAKISAFNSQTAVIAAMAAQYMPLTINGVADKAGFTAVHEARLTVKKTRVAVEKRRKDLKADALEYGRLVDDAAKKLTALLEPIEEHLEKQEDAIVAERERIKREEREKQARELQERVAAMAKVEAPIDSITIGSMDGAQYTAALARYTQAYEERKAEEARIAAEKLESQRLEAERIAAERAELEAERQRLAEVDRQQKAEAERIAAEQRRIDEAKAAEAKRIADAEAAEAKRIADAEAAEAKRLADIEAAKVREAEIEREREAAAERARIETEERIKREAEAAQRKAAREEAKRRKAEALRPDREKLLAYIDAVEAVQLAEVSEASAEFAYGVMQTIKAACDTLRDMIDETYPQPKADEVPA